MMLIKQAVLLSMFAVILISKAAVADDGVLRINFQAAGHPKPLRTGIVHLEDVGEVYGSRGNGETYGWSRNKTSAGRRRYDIGDCRLDGHVRGNSANWQIAIINGNYRVNIALGDPSNEDNFSFRLESTNFTDPEDDHNYYIVTDIAITVSDGKLTVTDTIGELKVCYIEIVDAAIGFPATQTFPALDPNQLAFPTAEGFAKNLTGGRGGDVYHVTSLDWSGPGTLQNGFSTTYDNHPRTIVFDIGGHIGCSNPMPGKGSIGCNGLDDELNCNGYNITVAGQTAPGGGVTIRDHPVIIKNSGNIILRYLRIRLGDENKGPENGDDGLTTEDNAGLFLDHISMSWTIDGMWDSRRCGNMSVQWCIFAEPLDDSLHEKDRHGYLMSFRNLSDDITLHHNLFSSGTNRHPTLASNEYEDYDHLADFRNNVNYNWSRNMRSGSCNQNIINNTFRFGPNGYGTGSMIDVTNKMPNPWGYLSGNQFESADSDDTADCARYTADNYTCLSYTEEPVPSNRSEYEVFTEWTLPGYTPPVTESAEAALQSIVNHAGCSLVRDAVDSRMINNLVTNSGRIVDSPTDVGGYDNYPSLTRPENYDTDRDGMPNTWEVAQGLDPDNPADRNDDADGDGYTNLEEYLNGLLIGSHGGSGGDNAAIKINFQTSSAVVPTGYLKDDGSSFGERGNGYTYGWDSDIREDARERDDHEDQRYDTLVHMVKHGTHSWELEIPNGDYTVEILVGDPSYTQLGGIYVEGAIYNDPAGGEVNFDLYTDINVRVNDGKLTLDPVDDEDPKLCYIHVIPQSDAINPGVGPFTRGDSNGDGTVNISDPNFTVNWLFLGGGNPPCLAAADANQDGSVDISDPSYSLRWLFLGDADHPAPTTCGNSTDEGDVAQGCETATCE